MTGAILLMLAAAIGGAYLLWRFFLSPAAQIRKDADAVRAAGGPTDSARAGGGGANLGDAFSAIDDALTHGFGARQEREEAANASINADVELRLIEQIERGEWTYLEVDVPPGVPAEGTLEGGRRLKLLIRKRRTDPRALGVLVGDIARTVFDPSTASLDLQLSLSADRFLTQDYIVLNPPFEYDVGDIFAFTEDNHFRLSFVEFPGVPYPNTTRLLAAYDAWTARNRARGGGVTGAGRESAEGGHISRDASGRETVHVGGASNQTVVTEAFPPYTGPAPINLLVQQGGTQTVRVSPPTPAGTYRARRA